MSEEENVFLVDYKKRTAAQMSPSPNAHNMTSNSALIQKRKMRSSNNKEKQKSRSKLGSKKENGSKNQRNWSNTRKKHDSALRLQILVVCSSFTGKDFNNTLNNDLKLLFGPKPNYIYCDGDEMSLEELNGRTRSFPVCPNGTDKYDFIWFAGCNLIQNIFRSGKEMVTLEKIRNSLHPDGHFLFTETPNFLRKYTNYENSLTLPIEIIDLHSQKFSFYDRVNIEIIVDYFKRHFVQVKLNNHIAYRIRKEGGINKNK